MSGGWPVIGHAKSVTFRAGQANGVPCRVEWASWLLDVPQLTLELPAGLRERRRVRRLGDSEHRSAVASRRDGASLVVRECQTWIHGRPRGTP
jgi:hypothetical protein